VEHTFLVTLVGLDIMRGRSLSERIAPDEFNHVLIACLLHDIGYVRGILRATASIVLSLTKQVQRSHCHAALRMRLSAHITLTAQKFSPTSGWSIRRSTLLE